MLRTPESDDFFRSYITPLEGDPSVIFTLDDRLRLRSCNLAWDRFAAQNGGGSHLLRAAVIGRPVLEFVSGSLVEYYQAVYRRVLESKSAWRHEYECSSADTCRLLAMHVYPLPAGSGLLIVNSLHVQTPHSRAGHPPLEGSYRTADGIVVVCGNCRRTRRNGFEEEWDWVPAFVAAPIPQTSHGLCPPCAEHYDVTVVREGPRAD